MSRPSLLEAQYNLHAAKPEYGAGAPGVQLYDMDADQYVSPGEVGLAADLDQFPAFMIARGADPEHLKYMTIGLYGPDSEFAPIPGTKRSYRNGFVGTDLCITSTSDEWPLRFPIIALRHDPSRVM